MIHFPRRLNLGFRPWYGLTMRQLAYLLFAAMFAGLGVLTGPTEGAQFILRILIGLVVIGIGVALAFFRFNGMTLEWWIVARIKFLLKTQRSVWNKGEGRRADVNADMQYAAPSAPAAPPAPVVAPVVAPAPKPAPFRPSLRSDSVQKAIYIFADMAMLLALLALTLWLKNQGWSDLQLWYISLSNH